MGKKAFLFSVSFSRTPSPNPRALAFAFLAIALDAFFVRLRQCTAVAASSRRAVSVGCYGGENEPGLKILSPDLRRLGWLAGQGLFVCLLCRGGCWCSLEGCGGIDILTRYYVHGFVVWYPFSKFGEVRRSSRGFGREGGRLLLLDNGEKGDCWMRCLPQFVGSGRSLTIC